MGNAVFGKVIENVRKHKDIKLVITEPRRNCLVSEPNFGRTRFFSESLLTIEMERTLEISEIVMCELWYDYVKPKYKEKTKLCYMQSIF